jgi:hypothetical protein
MKPNRRWLQGSLRSFLALIAALAIWLGWQANRLRRQAEAVRAFHQTGGIVGYRAPPPPGQKLAIELFAAEYSWRDYFRTPTDVKLQGDDVDDEVCRHLDDLPDLQTLELTRTRATGAVAEHVRRLKRLKELWVFDQALTAEDVEHLRRVVPPGCEIFR